MNLETYTAFVLFVIVMTGTPGVGNLTMMAIGQNAGYRAALPFLAGATAGCVCLNTCVGLGLGGLLLASPRIAAGLKLCGMAYILYLGWKILCMRPGQARADKTFTFWEGLFVHPTNPKSWAMSVVGFSQLAVPGVPLWQQMALFVPTFLFFQVLFHSTWGLAGTALMRFLESPRTLLTVNSLLVTVMVGATMYAMFI